MKHKLIWVLVTLPMWLDDMGIYSMPFQTYQCATCKKYWIKTDSSVWYAESNGLLVKDTPYVGKCKMVS